VRDNIHLEVSVAVIPADLLDQLVELPHCQHVILAPVVVKDAIAELLVADRFAGRPVDITSGHFQELMMAP